VLLRLLLDDLGIPLVGLAAKARAPVAFLRVSVITPTTCNACDDQCCKVIRVGDPRVIRVGGHRAAAGVGQQRRSGLLAGHV